MSQNNTNSTSSMVPRHPLRPHRDPPMPSFSLVAKSPRSPLTARRRRRYGSRRTYFPVGGQPRGSYAQGNGLGTRLPSLGIFPGNSAELHTNSCTRFPQSSSPRDDGSFSLHNGNSYIPGRGRRRGGGEGEETPAVRKQCWSAPVLPRTGDVLC